MVGVPGRSRGCITCRKRKKGCDRRTPVCDRCVRARVTCEGYETDRIWLNSTASAASGQESCTSPQLEVVSDIRPWIVSYAKRRESGSHVVLPDSFARSAREQLYFGLFWNLMIPDGPQFSPESSDLSSVGWTRFIGDLYNTETALRYATVATATSILGRINNDEQLRLKGLQVYNWTIQEMIKAVKQPNRAKSDSLVVAARVMALYELFFGPDGDPGVAGWQRHSEGQLAMFLERGPESFISGVSHQLFVDSRINIILLAIRRRCSTPFSSDDWKTIPWAITEKSTKDKLIDAMSGIPDILVQVDLLAAVGTQESTDVMREKILPQCREVEAALIAWRTHIDLSIYDYAIAGLPLPIPQLDSDFSLLHLSCVYWSICLMLSCIIESVSEDTTDSAYLECRDQNSIGRPEQYASKIFHCGHLFFEPMAGAVQGGSGLFPMVCAWRFYELAAESSGKRSAELQILYDLFDKPFMGSQVGRYLTHLQKSMWKHDLSSQCTRRVGLSRSNYWMAWF
ncbi:Zn(2)-C6 fungal-type domain-containing protein [Trichoderma simmonsii]|uniref:Zn(2)-C6 fungal-type domain-containing protein n=2 Tax=Trichoderma simmonsii TaxID=1491479 RepID=A0A8G0LJW6_9HYPO|nr:Zn(2)-C6 fungal-type domain-containing protein [Trichoderma simmonsii]